MIGGLSIVILAVFLNTLARKRAEARK